MHISKATLDALHGAYHVEPADGKSRNSLLAKHGTETFFVTYQSTRTSVDAKSLEVITINKCRLIINKKIVYARARAYDVYGTVW